VRIGTPNAEWFSGRWLLRGKIYIVIVMNIVLLLSWWCICALF
jgi:hypothetical protein